MKSLTPKYTMTRPARNTYLEKTMTITMMMMVMTAEAGAMA